MLWQDKPGPGVSQHPSALCHAPDGIFSITSLQMTNQGQGIEAPLQHNTAKNPGKTLGSATKGVLKRPHGFPSSTVKLLTRKSCSAFFHEPVQTHHTYSLLQEQLGTTVSSSSMAENSMAPTLLLAGAQSLPSPRVSLGHSTGVQIYLWVTSKALGV